MALHRVLRTWWFAAAGVLPLWLLVGYAVWGSSVGGLLAVVLVAPVVLLVELGLALLFTAGARVRRTRVPDPLSIVLVSAFQAGVVGFGFFGPATAWFALLAAAAAIGGFWYGGRRLAGDVRTRVREVLAPLQRPRVDRTPIDAGEYVVVKPSGR